VTSFVHPGRVPQLADAEALLAALPRPGGVVYTALVPNERGLERALATGVPRIAVFLAAAETCNQRNVGMGIAASLSAFERLVPQALAAGHTVRGYLSTCFACPYEGAVDPVRVAEIAGWLLAMGVDQVSLGDTTGVAVPTDVARVLEVAA